MPDVHKAKTRHAWVVDVNMGYGHSRPAHVLAELSGGEIVTANDYVGIPAHDRKRWKQSRQLYETVSRLKPVPLIGDMAFGILNRLQKIDDFYPRRDLSRPNLQLRQMYRMLKAGLGKHLIDKLAQEPLPLVTTFFLTAFMADYFNYPGDIYCVTTDADLSRAWAPLEPKRSRIKYFASNGRVVERLKLYGVPANQIFLTGFPLPKELIGGPEATALKRHLVHRICRLDPKGIFQERYEKTLRAHLGNLPCESAASREPLTLTYSVGGAGAQRKLGVDILQGLRRKIAREEIRLNLVAGVRSDMAEFYEDAAKAAGLKKSLGTFVCVASFATREEYFAGFNKILETTDILWTKPSELSFYTGLGLPIVMAPTIGSQEDFNQLWLGSVGSGVPQLDPRYTDEWLFDWVNSGALARLAWNGYVEAPTHGVYRIEDIVLGRKSELHELPLIV